jgi:hypothetical protein
MLYQYSDTLYSAIVAAAVDYSSKGMVSNNERRTQITVRHPTLKSGKRFILTFDEGNRLIERQLLHNVPMVQQPVVFEVHRFLDYQAHLDQSGETIWFPRRAEYHYYKEQPVDGKRVEWMTERFTIADVKFNIDIPDHYFTFDPPKNAKVYDGLTGQGWLPAQADQTIWADPQPPPRPTAGWSVWALAALALASVAVLFGALRYRRRRYLTP